MAVSKIELPDTKIKHLLSKSPTEISAFAKYCTRENLFQIIDTIETLLELQLKPSVKDIEIAGMSFFKLPTRESVKEKFIELSSEENYEHTCALLNLRKKIAFGKVDITKDLAKTTEMHKNALEYVKMIETIAASTNILSILRPVFNEKNKVEADTSQSNNFSI